MQNAVNGLGLSTANGARDWAALFAKLGEATVALASAPIIQADPLARSLIRRIADASDMEELDCCVDLLGLRLSELMGDAGANAFGARAGRAPPTSRRGDDDGAPARTFLKL